MRPDLLHFISLSLPPSSSTGPPSFVTYPHPHPHHHRTIAAAIRECCVQLRRRLVKEQEAQAKADRRRKLAKYIPNVAKALAETLLQFTSPIGTISIPEFKPHALQDNRLIPMAEPRLRFATDLLRKVTAGTVTEATLESKLEDHVQQVDESLAMQAMLSSGGNMVR